MAAAIVRAWRSESFSDIARVFARSGEMIRWNYYVAGGYRKSRCRLFGAYRRR